MGSNSTVLLSGHKGPPLPDTDLPQAADSNFPSNIPLEPSGTGYVENLVRLQAEVATDDFLHDLDGAAEDRLDAAEPPKLTLVSESSGLVLSSVKAGSVWSARAAAFAWCDLGCDHAPWDRLASWQLPSPRRGPDNDAEPATANIPAVDADVDSGELIATQLPQILVIHDARDGSQVGSCSREPPRGDQDLSGVRTLTTA
jgi:hypothetical protein